MADTIHKSDGAKGLKQIQDFTQIKTVGAVDQQAAGHIWQHANGGYNEPGTTWAEVLAYYKFASGSLLVDEKGVYALIDVGGVSGANGIFGDGNAVEGDGAADYYTQSTFLDSMPTSLVADFWFNADDGQPAGNQYFFIKQNDASNRFASYINAAGQIVFDTEENGNGVKTLLSSTLLPNGITGWNYVAICQDATYGKRMFINSLLEARDPLETTLMANASANDMHIMAFTGGANYFDGKFGPLRFRDKIVKQKDIDVGHASNYAVPSFLVNNEYNIRAQIQRAGSTDFVRPYDFEEIARDSSYIYRSGGLITGLESDDKLKLMAVA